MTSDVVKETMEKVLAAFKNPEDLPAKMAFLYINLGRWSSRWSMGNQVITMINGAADAATKKTWLDKGREVNDDAEGFYILRPLKRTFWAEVEDRDGKIRKVKRSFIYDYAFHEVFRIEDSEVVDDALWKKFSDNTRAVEFEQEATAFFKPILDKLELKHFQVSDTRWQGAAGFYSHNHSIDIGVESLQVVAHETVHAIEGKLGNLTRAPGQQPDNELVAELGSAVLLNLMGSPEKVDLGRTYDYLRSYAKGEDPTKACMSLLWRIDTAMKFALDHS